MAPKGFWPKKQRGQARPGEEERSLRASVANLLSTLQALFEPKRAAGGFNMHCGDVERERMIDWLWAGDFTSATHEMLDNNPELATYIDERTKHGRHPPDPSDRVASDRRRRTRHNFLSGILARNRSKDFVPEHQLLLSIQAHAKQINVLSLLGHALICACAVIAHLGDEADRRRDEALPRLLV